MIPSSALTQWEGRTFLSVKVNVSAPCIRKEAISLPPPPPLPVFGSISVLRVHIFHPGIYHLSGWPICDLATGQVLPVGEFIRHMPVTLLSRIHFQINRRSSWAFKREFRSRCAKLPLPKIFQSRLLRRDSLKWMRHFQIFKILKIISYFFFFFRNKNDGKKNRLREILIYI